MTYSEIISIIKTGKTAILPNWKGLFKWDYANKELYFVDGDYRLNQQQLIDMGLKSRTDWYHII